MSTDGDWVWVDSRGVERGLPSVVRYGLPEGLRVEVGEGDCEDCMFWQGKPAVCVRAAEEVFYRGALSSVLVEDSLLLFQPCSEYEFSYRPLVVGSVEAYEGGLSRLWYELDWVSWECRVKAMESGTDDSVYERAMLVLLRGGGVVFCSSDVYKLAWSWLGQHVFGGSGHFSATVIPGRKDK